MAFAYGAMDYDPSTQKFFVINERVVPGMPCNTQVQALELPTATQPQPTFTSVGATTVFSSAGCFASSYKGGVSGLAVVPCTCEADLMVLDTPYDDGFEPNADTGAMNVSPAIWVRKTPDGLPAPQDPSSGQANGIYVRVNNLGCATETATVEVWSSAGFTARAVARLLGSDRRWARGHRAGEQFSNRPTILVAPLARPVLSVGSGRHGQPHDLSGRPDRDRQHQEQQQHRFHDRFGCE
jgi:hypothetical protein